MFDDHEEEQDYHSFEDTRKMPIFLKAEEILTLTRRITEIVSREDSNAEGEFEHAMLENYAEYLMTNASLIPAKIAGAEGGDLYDIRMENAAIIRKAAREILTDCTGLEITGFKEIDYLELLRDEIEDFRILFAEWVKTFKIDNYLIDRWGLFNPPGVNYDDYDPDDDISFNPDDYFDDIE